MAVDSHSQDEGEEDDMHEVSDSLADSSSKTAQSLPVTCGQSLSASQPRACLKYVWLWKDPVHEAFIDESIIENVYVMIERVLKPTTTEGPL